MEVLLCVNVLGNVLPPGPKKLLNKLLEFSQVMACNTLGEQPVDFDLMVGGAGDFET